jgi:hypothetical protein
MLSKLISNAEERKVLRIKISEKDTWFGAKHLILSQDGKEHIHESEIMPCGRCSGPLIRASERYAWKLYDYKNNDFLKKEPEFLEIINDFKIHGVRDLPSYENKCPQDVISNISIFLQGVGNLTLEELQVIVDLTDHAHSWEIHNLVELLEFREWLLE